MAKSTPNAGEEPHDASSESPQTKRARPAGSRAAAGKAPARKAAPTAPASAGQKEPGKTVTGTRRPGTKATKETKFVISPGEKQRMIAEAAYYIAKRRGFAGGLQQDDWYKAEAEIEKMLRAQK